MFKLHNNIYVASKFKLTEINLIYIFFSLFFVLFSTWYLASFVYNFPDYYNYDRYIKDGTSFIRFSTEPLSAAVMYVLHYFRLSAYEYYFASILMLYTSYCFVSSRVENASKFFVLVFLVFNPLNLILIQTPRYGFAMSLCIVAFFSKSNYKSFLLIALSLLFHNVMAAFAVVFLITSRVSNKLNIFITGSSITVFILILYGVIPLGFENFSVSEIQRGVGRLSVFFIFALYVILSHRGWGKDKLHLVIMAIYIIALFFISPFTHRLSSFYIVVMAYYLFSKQNMIENRIVNYIYCSLFLLGSYYILATGSFGYA
ncbi:EpsG family protein (plasmid) [Proteus mirabilis]|uniref:EpsG family protein n=1 Tax=Proteus mirabilis TaxID=584 RepID=UPI0038F63E45